MSYKEICSLLEPGIRSIWANDPLRMEQELRFMRLAAMDKRMIDEWVAGLVERIPPPGANAGYIMAGICFTLATLMLGAAVVGIALAWMT